MNGPGAKGRENSKERKVLLVSHSKEGDGESQGDTGTSSQVCELRTHLPGTYFYNPSEEGQSFAANGAQAFNRLWRFV